MNSSSPRRPINLEPPLDWRDGEGWDAFWEGCLTSPHGETFNPFFSNLFFSLFFVRIFPEVSSWRGLSVLVVGNGLDLLPRILERAGCQVVVLEISEVALSAVALAALSPGSIGSCERFLASRGFRGTPLWADGGACTFLHGDLFDPRHAPGPFEVIVSLASLQGFSGEDARAAVLALDARLAPRGTFFVGINNENDALLEKVGRPFVDLRYRTWHGEEPRPPGKVLVPSGKLFWSLEDLSASRSMTTAVGPPPEDR